MSFIIQSIIYFKSGWSKQQAIDWLKEHQKKTGIDEKENTYRARQREPSEFDHNSFHIKEINKNMDFVMGRLKK